jgi:hypothetical protein
LSRLLFLLFFSCGVAKQNKKHLILLLGVAFLVLARLLLLPFAFLLLLSLPLLLFPRLGLSYFAFSLLLFRLLSLLLLRILKSQYRDFSIVNVLGH